MSQTQAPQRRPIIAANWKMYKTPQEVEAFIKEFLPKLPAQLDRDIVLCPSFVGLSVASSLLSNSEVALGAQNANENSEGAFTGEISTGMLKAIGCQYVIVGHSERRQYYGESNASVNKKLAAIFKSGLLPIFCVGETLDQRDANETINVVRKQVIEGLENLSSGDVRKLIIAYEPIWAIGTGRTATPAQAQEVHLAIRDILKDQYGSLTSHDVRILYGGSVKPENMVELMACEDIDGGLVGGASLKADSFAEIVNFKSSVKSV